MKLQCTAKCVINGFQYAKGDVVEISKTAYDLHKDRFDSSMKVTETAEAAAPTANPLVERKHIIAKLKELGVPFASRCTNADLRDLLAAALDPKGQPEAGK